MRLLAIDLGDRRIGLAIGDSATGQTRGLTTLTRRAADADLERLGRIVAHERVEAVVVGLPLDTDGTEGPQAMATRAWATDVLGRLGLPFGYRDERWTSQDAEAALGRAPRGRNGGPPSAAARERRRRAVDREAARRILQAELDARTVAGS